MKVADANKSPIHQTSNSQTYPVLTEFSSSDYGSHVPSEANQRKYSSNCKYLSVEG